MFLCDEMVGGLGRWLRAAGYDTAMPPQGAGDEWLVACAATEGRTILTRDARIAERRLASGRVFRLHGDSLEGWAAQVAAGLGVDWRHRPFSRCLICNLPLRPHPLGPDAVPPRSRGDAGPVMQCPRCRRAYWQGGHHRRMSERLSRWRAGDFRAGG